MPIKRRPISLAVRLTLWIGVAISVMFLSFGWLVQQSIAAHFAEQDADELRVVVQSVSDTLSHADHDGPDLTTRLSQAVMGHHNVFFYVADAQNRPLYRMEGPDLGRLAARAPAVTQLNPDQLYIWPEQDQTYRGTVIAFAHPTLGALRIVAATAMDFHRHYLHKLQHTLWLTTLAACIFTTLLVWLAVQRGHAPIRQMRQTIRGIRSDQLHTRLDPDAVPIELAELARSFNDMLRRIEEGFQRLSHFSADIAHELRTPVTNLTTQTQVALGKPRPPEAYREILYSNLEEYERMAKMIGDMLFLAKTDKQQRIPTPDQVDLGAEITALFDYFEALAEEKSVQLQQIGQASQILGDRLMLRRALSNLLSNAIRHTPADHTITVRLSETERSVSVEVENPGTAIAPEHLPHLFDRFYRVDPARQRGSDGAGLGLAIVKSIVEGHGGEVQVRSDAQRTAFTLTLIKPAH